MTNYYSQNLSDEKFSSKEKKKRTSQKDFEYDYIWEQQLIRNDISTINSFSKSVFLIVIGFAFMNGTYLIYKDLYLTFGLLFASPLQC